MHKRFLCSLTEAVLDWWNFLPLVPAYQSFGLQQTTDVLSQPCGATGTRGDDDPHQEGFGKDGKGANFVGSSESDNHVLPVQFCVEASKTLSFCQGKAAQVLFGHFLTLRATPDGCRDTVETKTDLILHPISKKTI